MTAAIIVSSILAAGGLLAPARAGAVGSRPGAFLAPAALGGGRRGKRRQGEGWVTVGGEVGRSSP